MRNFIRTLTLFFILTFILNTNVEAKGSIEITNWNVKCDVVEDGSIIINEYITFKFSGNFNGVYREIVTTDTSGIDDLKVIEKGTNTDRLFKKVDKGQEGKSGIYETNQFNDNVSIKIYSPSKDGEKTFNIVYKVKNICKKYNDVGELYYNFLGKENKTYIDNFNVNINFPYAFQKDRVKIFAHGPLNGVIKFVNNNAINLNVSNVSENNLVAARIVFPKDYIKSSNNIINKDGYAQIMEEEKYYINRIKEDEARKEESRKKGKYASVIVSLLGIYIILASKKRYKEKDVLEINEIDMLPSECTPAVLSQFYNLSIDSKALLATILDLNRKGYFKIEEIPIEEPNEKTSWGKIKDKPKNYNITKVKDDELLLEHEKYFIKWIIDRIGDAYSVTTENIKEYSKKNSGDFVQAYNEWTNLVKEETKKRGYFDLKSADYGVTMVGLSIVMIIISIALMVFSGLYGLMAMTPYIILIGICINKLIYKKTDYGIKEYKRWRNFKESILKKDKEYLFHMYPMDRYFVYSLVLGIEDKKINEFKDVIDNIYHNDGYNYYGYGWLYFYSGMYNGKTGLNDFNTSINSSFNVSGPSVGGGGGFSSGGGGAGGGGAGGF
ncbi:DUF2207 domain-containing protein [Clostridium lundense]|uniref:DUF2207 domain-containing protein n=1 Tax=Clostridium lundense TaxID=319475 RepID=UPI000687489A|nr:DUF2207 domain-containing protein [Clostridium lundense]